VRFGLGCGSVLGGLPGGFAAVSQFSQLPLGKFHFPRERERIELCLQEFAGQRLLALLRCREIGRERLDRVFLLRALCLVARDPRRAEPARDDAATSAQRSA